MEFIEYLAIGFTVGGVLLSIQQKKLTWLFYIIAAVLYGLVFLSKGLLADTELQGFFVVSSIYAWVKWNNLEKNWKPEYSSTKFLAAGTFLSIVFAIILAEFHLYFFQNVSLAYVDALLASLSIFATILEAKKKVESWYFWIFINFSYTGMYFMKDLIPSSILFFIFVILSFRGLLRWRKKI